MCQTQALDANAEPTKRMHKLRKDVPKKKSLLHLPPPTHIAMPIFCKQHIHILARKGAYV